MSESNDPPISATLNPWVLTDEFMKILPGYRIRDNVGIVCDGLFHQVKWYAKPLEPGRYKIKLSQEFWVSTFLPVPFDVEFVLVESGDDPAKWIYPIQRHVLSRKQFRRPSPTQAELICSIDSEFEATIDQSTSICLLARVESAASVHCSVFIDKFEITVVPLQETP